MTRIGVRIGPTLPRPKATNPAGRPPTVSPLVTKYARPPNTIIVATVTMIGEMARRRTRSPLASPSASPKSRPDETARGALPVDTATLATTTPTSE